MFGELRESVEINAEYNGSPEQIFNKEELNKLKNIADDENFLICASMIFGGVMYRLSIEKECKKPEPQVFKDDLKRLSEALSKMEKYTKNILNRELKQKIGWVHPRYILSSEEEGIIEPDYPDKDLKYDSHLLKELSNVTSELAILPSQGNPARLFLRNNTYGVFSDFKLKISGSKNGPLRIFLDLMEKKAGFTFGIEKIIKELQELERIK